MAVFACGLPEMENTGQKEYSTLHRDCKRTGGGPVPVKKPSDTDYLLMEISAEDFEIDESTCDRTLIALSDGMQYGWTSPISMILLSPTSPVPLTEIDIIILEVLYMLGGAVGIPLTLYLLNTIGRKYTMLVAAGEGLIGWIVLATVPSREVLFVIRILMGIAADVNFVTTPIYIAEISQKHLRGRLGSIIHIMMVTGILLIYLIGPFVSITASSTVGACVVTIQLLTFSMMPESPYYYLIKNRKDEARKSLQIFRSKNDVEFELNEIEESIKKENAERRNVLDLFRVNSNLKGVIIMTVLNLAQHFGAITVMFMNMHTILEDASALLTTNQAAILFSLLLLVSCVISGLMMDKFGRKVILCTSCFLTGISLFILASYFAVKNAGVDMLTVNWVPVFAVLLYAFTFKFGLGLVPIILTAEVFASNVKAYGVTFADFVYVFGAILSIIAYYVLHINIGMEAPFYFFSVCSFLTCIFSILYIPETKGKTLEEIQRLLKGETSPNTDRVSLTKTEKEHQPIVPTNVLENLQTYGTNDS
ncbi:hypothetical protein FQR65_LT06572 [Abscondita terminalis]|nr:hypothetical protein FQR65_LT06572 [Abscondita terminalis]